MARFDRETEQSRYSSKQNVLVETVGLWTSIEPNVLTFFHVNIETLIHRKFKESSKDTMAGCLCLTWLCGFYVLCDWRVQLHLSIG